MCDEAGRGKGGKRGRRRVEERGKKREQGSLREKEREKGGESE